MDFPCPSSMLSAQEAQKRWVENLHDELFWWPGKGSEFSSSQLAHRYPGWLLCWTVFLQLHSQLWRWPVFSPFFFNTQCFQIHLWGTDAPFTDTSKCLYIVKLFTLKSSSLEMRYSYTWLCLRWSQQHAHSRKIQGWPVPISALAIMGYIITKDTPICILYIWLIKHSAQCQGQLNVN